MTAEISMNYKVHNTEYQFQLCSSPQAQSRKQKRSSKIVIKWKTWKERYVLSRYCTMIRGWKKLLKYRAMYQSQDNKRVCMMKWPVKYLCHIDAANALPEDSLLEDRSLFRFQFLPVQQEKAQFPSPKLPPACSAVPQQSSPCRPTCQLMWVVHK